MKKYRILIILTGILAVGFLLSPTGVLKPAKNLLFEVSKPFAMVGNFTVDRISLFFRNFFHLASLSGQNEDLIRENLELQSQVSLLKEAQHENEILKKELGFLANKGDLKLLPANIIGRSISGYLRTIVIDRGSNDGLKKGQAIISSGFLVGTISEVMENSSQVTLITDYNSLVPVILQDSRGTGLLRGGLQGLVVEDIPLNIPINPGEQVITSGLGGEIPQGIPVGKVQELISKEGEIFQKASVDTPIKIYYLEFVFVAQ